VVKSLKESQQRMGVDKSSEDNQIPVTKGGQVNNYHDQYGRQFTPKRHEYYQVSLLSRIQGGLTKHKEDDRKFEVSSFYRCHYKKA